MSIELLAPTNQQEIPTKPTIRQLGLYRNGTFTKGDGYTSWLQGSRGSDGWTRTAIYTRKFLDTDNSEILNYMFVNISADGTPVSYTKTPPAPCSAEEITTAGWFRLPTCSVKTAIETYSNGTEWYRVWNDGWKEQGGLITGAKTVLTFNKPFSNTNYNIQISVSDGSPTDWYLSAGSWNNKTSTNVTIYIAYNGVQ